MVAGLPDDPPMISAFWYSHPDWDSSTLDQGWFVWWIAHGRSNDKLLQSAGFKRLHFQFGLSLGHFLSHSLILSFPISLSLSYYIPWGNPAARLWGHSDHPREVHTRTNKGLQLTTGQEPGPLPEMIATLSGLPPCERRWTKTTQISSTQIPDSQKLCWMFIVLSC